MERIRNRLALLALRVRFDVYQGTARFEAVTAHSSSVRGTRKTVYGCPGSSHSGYGGHPLSVFSEGRCFRFWEWSGDCAVSVWRGRRQIPMADIEAVPLWGCNPADNPTAPRHS